MLVRTLKNNTMYEFKFLVCLIAILLSNLKQEEKKTIQVKSIELFIEHKCYATKKQHWTCYIHHTNTHHTKTNTSTQQNTGILNVMRMHTYKCNHTSPPTAIQYTTELSIKIQMHPREKSNNLFMCATLSGGNR